LKALESKILDGLHASLKRSWFTRIHYDIGPVAPPRSPKRKSIRMLKTQTPTPNTPAPVDTASLERIQDPALRDTLHRLAHKLRFVALALVALVGLSNCSTLAKPMSGLGTADTPDFENSYAVRHISKLNEQDPGKFRDPRAYYHFLMDLKYEREGDFDQAARHYAEVIKYEPLSERFHTHMMVLYLRTGQLDEAMAVGNTALERFPNNTRIHTIVGDILFSRGQYRGALVHFKKVSELAPKSPRSFLMAGAALRQMGQYEEAKAWFHQATVIDPANTLGFYYYGKTLLDLGDIRGAEEKLKKSVSLRPSMIEARTSLAVALEKMGKYQDALTQYRILNKLEPYNNSLNEHYEALSQAWDPATETLTAGVDIKPVQLTEPNIHRMIAIIFYQQVMYLEAIEEFRLVLAHKEDKAVRFTIAKIYEVLGRPDKAIQEIEAHRKHVTDPDSVEILLKLARLYGLEENMSRSVDLLGQAVELEPNNHRLYHAMTLAYMSLNRNDQALKTINRAIALDESRDAYYFEKGALLERMGRYEEAIKSMKKALQINPNHSNAHNFIGYMYATRNIQLDKALYHIEQALTIQPRNGYFLDSLGWIYYKKGQPEQALTHIKRAMVYAEPDPVLYDHLGDVYFSLKQIGEAHKAWKTSLVLTRQRLQNPSGELPDPDKLEEKINKAEQLMQVH
jgi:tetratricopeptide (TPR) repeat protein